MPDYLVERDGRQFIYSTDRPPKAIEAEGYRILGEADVWLKGGEDPPEREKD